jgi:hypothetical protein
MTDFFPETNVLITFPERFFALRLIFLILGNCLAKPSVTVSPLAQEKF